MCNKIIIDHQQQHKSQTVYLMNSHSLSPVSALPSSIPGSSDEISRVKFLCSFLGSILPRPQDGKLRYVGGETRIVSVPRDISYVELMSKMRELYDGAAVLKYQQPDEDLDALVSVVNDDDMVNMMEEYEKLASSDGFTRLRIFLFSHPDQDVSSYYVDGNERRYVDALKSLNEGSDFRKCDSPAMSTVSDDIHLAEQFFNGMSIDESWVHIQRSGVIPTPSFNLHSHTIPHLGSGQWSPVCYSTSHHGYLTPRTLSGFPPSPSSAHYRMQEEYVQQRLNRHPQYEHQPHFPDNVAWMPNGAMSGDKVSGFHGNILHSQGVHEGNHNYEHCRATFCRNQSPHLEHHNMGNAVPQINSSCAAAECPPNQEAFMMHADGKLHLGFYSKDQTDPSSAHGETHGFLQHQLNPCVEEARNHVYGFGRLNEHNVLDGAGMNSPLEHAGLADGHHMLSNYVHQRAGAELGNEVIRDQTMVASAHLHIPPEERGPRYGNYPYPHGGDNVYQASQGHVRAQSLQRNFQNHTHGAPAYEAYGLPQQINSPVNFVFLKDPAEGSAMHFVATDGQNPWVESPQKVLSSDGTAVPDIVYAHVLKVDVGPHCQETQNTVTMKSAVAPQDMLKFATATEPVQLPDQALTLIHDTSISSSNLESYDSSVIGVWGIEDKIVLLEDEANHVAKMEKSDVPSMCSPEQNKIPEDESKIAPDESSIPICLKLAEKGDDQAKQVEKDPSAAENSKLSVNRLSFIPEFVASVTKVALEEGEEVKAKVEDVAPIKHDAIEKEAAANESKSMNPHGELELDSDNDNITLAKIEPTKAEEEAFARGLQTIKNDDLEEIRELGSGTYGAVYQGKWKGSVVAIKRIKASCFAGRPAERERMIADFWKEALILSSLHHPNVVSFYGIVRDSPDGFLATVAEFMVNGSLKQFLQKDRTIDRLKRLIIAMDVAFGMAYLHGKNIVHFDLKCENLLVNMRDLQRPVCKIGDLGLSKVRQHTLVSGGVCGTLPWMAPELLSGKSDMVSEKIDVYSFGIVMWELLTGEEPYADIHCASIIGGIVNNTLRPKIPSWCDPEWKALMERCWASDPTDRPSFSEISQKLRNMAAAVNIE
ncbi:hypothetical protein ERO13_A05G005800v2 [Gossypium hirsutum]|nr:hypothetical protein ERO13_A05G005800v2 [Gossypium hirsutum]KAG4197159.1 hypothetical protein ERO13_A05G005800v2 [Gossypium hirsutum]